MLMQEVFDFARVNVLTAAYDHIFEPAAELQIALLVHLDQVAREAD